MADATNRERALLYLKEQGIAEVRDDRPLTPWTDKQAAKLTALLDAAEQRVVGEIVAWLLAGREGTFKQSDPRLLLTAEKLDHLADYIAKRWGGNRG